MSRATKIFFIIASSLTVIALYSYFIGPYLVWFTGKVEPKLFATANGEFNGEVRSDKAQVGAEAVLKAKISRVNPLLEQPAKATLEIVKPNGQVLTVSSSVYWGLKFDVGPYYPETFFHIAGTDLDQAGIYKINSTKNGGFVVKASSFEVISGTTGKQIDNLLIKQDIGSYKFTSASHELIVDLISTYTLGSAGGYVANYIIKPSPPINFGSGKTSFFGKATVMSGKGDTEALAAVNRLKSETEYKNEVISINGNQVLHVSVSNLWTDYYVWTSGPYVVEIGVETAIPEEADQKEMSSNRDVLLRAYLDRYAPTYK